MKVLVVGSGGREHTLAWKIRKSPHVSWLGIAPGNGGATNVGELVDISANDFDGLKKYVDENQVNLVVVGPEDPLVNGISEIFNPETTYVFGPSAEAAKIEGSKSFAKDLMKNAGIPTADYHLFTDASEAKSFLQGRKMPVVVKASGLAAGKGVLICQTTDEAIEAVENIMEKEQFGAAGSEIVIEDFLEGPEVSLQVITDGENYITLPPSQDHKRIGEGDAGPNTGGMGAYCPTPVMTDELVKLCGQTIIEPTLKALRDAGTPYKGLLYAGLILTEDGPKVLEFNCRFGDPETQVVLPLLSVDLVDLMLLSITGKLGELMANLNIEPHEWQRISRTGFASTVILASQGYPQSYPKGKNITGIPSETEDLITFHAGTKWETSDLVTSGGRVLAVTGIGEDLKTSLYRSYEACEQIQFEGKYFRKDIGWRALAED